MREEREGETRDINLLIMGKMTQDMKLLERLSQELVGSDTKIIDNIQGVALTRIFKYS